jgi:heat shock protein HspQ
MEAFRLGGPRFKSGQVIHHRKLGYRGVIVSSDDEFSGSEEWYDKMARSRPPKDRPWYHVLVDNSTFETYVAERNLELGDAQPVDHPLVHVLWDELVDGVYVRTRPMN